MSSATASRQTATVGSGKNGSRDVNNEIELLRDDYVAEDWAAVQDLLAHPSAVALLAEARPHLAAVFGEAAPVRLTMVPEDGPEPFSLFADVCVTDDADTPFEKMKRFDEWWLDACVRSDGSLNFAVEFADTDTPSENRP